MSLPPEPALLSFPAHGVVSLLWRGRTTILWAGLGFAVLGIILAVLLPPEFVAEARLMPELSGKAGDALNRLASVAGFVGADFADEDADAIRPDLYPSVLQSTPFALQLAHQSVATANGHREPLERLLWKDSPLEPVRRWIAWAKPEPRPVPATRTAGTLHLSAHEHELVDEINERVRATFDTRAGLITITAKMPDAVAAAATAQLAMNYLTRYVSSYRTEKARQDLVFYRQQLDEARHRYHNAQAVLFRYNDQHRHVILQATTLERQRMEAELSIAQTVYTGLSSQYEQAKLKVQVKTPIFKVLEPPKVPLMRVSPKRTLIVGLCMMAGLILGILYVVFREALITGQLRTLFRPDYPDTLLNQTQRL